MNGNSVPSGVSRRSHLKDAQEAMGVDSFLKNYTLEAFATRYKELINRLKYPAPTSDSI